MRGGSLPGYPPETRWQCGRRPLLTTQRFQIWRRTARASTNGTDNPAAAPVPRRWAWADLMRRAFEIDVPVCPRCGGRLRLMATVEDPGAIRAILAVVTGRVTWWSECRRSAGRPTPAPTVSA